LDVALGYQRKGVGAALLKVVVSEVDKRGGEMYVASSPAGKGLYAKFGWKGFGEFRVDWNQFGVEKPDIIWGSMRDANGGQACG
jgi:GNAT superfamily N-acetyltransferase